MRLAQPPCFSKTVEEAKLAVKHWKRKLIHWSLSRNRDKQSRERPLISTRSLWEIPVSWFCYFNSLTAKCGRRCSRIDTLTVWTPVQSPVNSWWVTFIFERHYVPQRHHNCICQEDNYFETDYSFMVLGSYTNVHCENLMHAMYWIIHGLSLKLSIMYIFLLCVYLKQILFLTF